MRNAYLPYKIARVSWHGGTWPNRNFALEAEMRFIDKLLVSRSGAICLNGSVREMKQSYIDFWPCIETIRVHMASDNYWSQSYTTDFTEALALDGQL